MGPQGSQWVISAGLNEGEQVVVDGFQKIRPKAPITPVPWTPGGRPAGASGAPAAGASAAASGAAPAPAASSAASR
jgi:membrane fusion protein (multidrug efflux system)